ncbi:MAG: ATP-binding cassette domain-containing protein [Clostridiaceae bacterium]
MESIKVENLTFAYDPGTQFEYKALDNISFKIEKGAVLGIVGENGSGKSTLIKHFNGMLQPAEGSVKISGYDTGDKKSRNELWKKVGMVFQFPEQMLFEDTVYNEIAYGLKNLGVPKEEIPQIINESLKMVGLEKESIENASPLCLSGGIRRRVAIACILAMKPEILVLDEATAGLDLTGREKVMEVIRKIKAEACTTVVMVSHNLSELISVCSHMAVLKKGKLISFGRTRDVLACKDVQGTFLKMFPNYIQLIYRLSERYENINTEIITLKEAEAELHNLLLRGTGYERA